MSQALNNTVEGAACLISIKCELNSNKNGLRLEDNDQWSAQSIVPAEIASLNCSRTCKGPLTLQFRGNTYNVALITQHEDKSILQTQI